MANVTNQNPWIIDTASATPISTDILAIDQIKWVPGATATAGAECKITDASGSRVIFDEFATGANDDVFPLKLDHVKPPLLGLAVPTLAFGKVFVYFR